jgi:hypothetical protein
MNNNIEPTATLEGVMAIRAFNDEFNKRLMLNDFENAFDSALKHAEKILSNKKLKKFPVLIVRNDDNEDFIHLGKGFYRNKSTLKIGSMSKTPLEAFDKDKFTFYYG